MECIEYDPVEPTIYTEYTPLARKKSNTIIAVILIGTVVIITVIIVGYHLYQMNQKTIKEENTI